MIYYHVMDDGVRIYQDHIEIGFIDKKVIVDKYGDYGVLSIRAEVKEFINDL